MFKVIVQWIDGTHTVYNADAKNKREVELQFLDKFGESSDQIKAWNIVPANSLVDNDIETNRSAVVH